MESDISNKKTIIAHGIGFLLVLFLCLSVILVCLILFICFFIPNTETYLHWEYFIIPLIGVIFWSIELSIIIKKAQVKFWDKYFIIAGKYSKSFPKIKKKCEEFMDYKLTSKSMFLAIEFTFTSGNKKFFCVTEFTKNQVLQILYEIQKRGGLVGKKIELKHFYK